MRKIYFIFTMILFLAAGISNAQDKKEVIEKPSAKVPPALNSAPPKVTPAIRGLIERIEGRKVTIKRNTNTETVTVKEPENLKTFKKGDLVKFQRGILEKLTEKKPVDRMKPSFKPAVPPKPNVKPVLTPKTKAK